MSHELVKDPVAFWEQRHANSDPWRSGGDRGISVAENYEFYAFRLGKLIELIRRHAGAERPLRILDAGCGRGHLTEGLMKCGHRVHGIDSSETAIGHAIEKYGNRFECATLTEHQPTALYDVVVCMDVLFHILDDEVWQRSVTALGRYASGESVLVFTEAMLEERFTLGSYIVHRSATEYDELLAPHGFTRKETAPYNFGANPNGFAVYTRTF